MKTTLFFISIFSFFISSAQISPLERGQVTTSSGEIVEGQVYWESETQLSKAFTLHTEKGEQVFGPENVKTLLLLNDSLVFEPVIHSRMANGKKTTSKYLARLIAKGKVSLYRLELDAVHYDVQEGFNYVFILRKDDKDYTLLHAPKSFSQGYNKYKEMLRYLLKDSPVKPEEIEKTAYSEKDLTDLIRKLGGVEEQFSLKIYTTKKTSFFSHQLRLGYSYCPDFRYESAELKNGMGFAIGYGLDVTTPRISKRYFTTFEAVYTHQEWPSTSYKDFYGNTKALDLVRDGIRVSLIGNYQFTYTRIRPLLLFGISGTYSFREGGVLPSFLIGAGAKMSRFTMTANYERPIYFVIGENAGSFIHVKLGIGLYQSPKTKG
jgi:hypothetical protein